MEKTVFRKSSMESLNSPEQLNDYIKAASPAVWIILAAIIALLCAVFAWIYFGCIYTRVQGVAVNDNGILSCYVRAEDMLKAGDSVKVSVNGTDYTVTEIIPGPFKLDPAGSAVDQIISTIGGFNGDEWLIKLSLSDNTGIPELTVEGAVITIEEIRPLSFITGGSNG
jgi:hypothetical protein